MYDLLVTAFSKKTGDYQSLSSVDIKLMALTYQLECEHGPFRGENTKGTDLDSFKEVN